MMARRTMLGTGLGALTALFAAGCAQYPKYVYRFKLTVEIDTPDGVRSGYSVYEVTAQKHAKLLPEARARSRDVRGEAVAVDLPGGKTVFALLKTINGSGDDNLAYLSMATLDPAYQNDWIESAQRIISGVGTVSPAEVATENYPMLVMFKDINNPTSIERIEPAAIGIRRIVVEVTVAPLTTGINSRLPWLLEKNRKKFDTNNKPKDIPIGDFKGLFSTELSK